MTEDAARDIYVRLEEQMPKVMQRVRRMLACGHSPAWIVERLRQQSLGIRRSELLGHPGLGEFRKALNYLVQRIVDGEEICNN
jgi:hypothetical protein